MATSRTRPRVAWILDLIATSTPALLLLAAIDYTAWSARWV